MALYKSLLVYLSIIGAGLRAKTEMGPEVKVWNVGVGEPLLLVGTPWELLTS